MGTWLRTLWRQWHNTEGREKAEVDRISVLQQAAQQRRAEHAEEVERAEREQHASPPSRKRVQEAEVAYATALQDWNNKQFRYRVR